MIEREREREREKERERAHQQYLTAAEVLDNHLRREKDWRCFLLVIQANTPSGTHSCSWRGHLKQLPVPFLSGLTSDPVTRDTGTRDTVNP